jgi:hypothetical protein
MQNRDETGVLLQAGAWHTFYRLPIAIEHALPNWPLVGFRKLSSFLPNHAGPDANLMLPPANAHINIGPKVDDY